MTSRDFCFWLQGFFEISQAGTLMGWQVDMVKSHLAMVYFPEIDPSIDGGDQVKKDNLDKANTNPVLKHGPGMRC